jgi:hypothetical protein
MKTMPEVKIRISSATSMALLAHHFMREYLYPMIAAGNEKPDVNSVQIVCLYGTKASGKSLFADSLFDEAEKLALIDPSSRKKYVQGMNLFKKNSSYRFRHMDTGAAWYDYALRDIHYVPGGDIRSYFKAAKLHLQEIQSKQGYTVRKITGKAGCDVIEHATIPHLSQATAGIFVADMNQKTKNGLYFSTTSKAIKNYTDNIFKKRTPYPVADTITRMAGLAAKSFDKIIANNRNLEEREVTIKLYDQTPQALACFQGMTTLLAKGL